MTEILILAGIGGALLGSVVTAAVNLSTIGRYRRAFHDLHDEHFQTKARLNRALDAIPPYERGTNGGVQRIGKILRGERS